MIERLGSGPEHFAPVDYAGHSGGGGTVAIPPYERPAPAERAERKLVGVDVFVMSTDIPDVLAQKLRRSCDSNVTLTMLTNRGIKVWPAHNPATFCTDHWRCRFQFEGAPDGKAIVALLGRLVDDGAEIIKTEHLYTFDGEAGYSLGQGQ